MNLATSMQGVATLWVLLGLTSSTALIALHQTATATPVFFGLVGRATPSVKAR